MTSQNFSSKFGSLEILRVSSRCGFISLWLQTRCTVLLLTLASRAIFRAWQKQKGCCALGRVPNHSKYPAHSPEKAASWSELRSKNTDSGTVSQFVALIEEIGDVKP